MKKYISLLITLILLFSIKSYNQQSSISVGILPFQPVPKSSRLKNLSEQVISGLSTVLFNYKFIKLIERSKTSEIFKEIKLGMTGLVDVNSAVKAGKLHGIKVLITGTVHRNKIYSRAIHVETGKIIASSSVNNSSFINLLGKNLARGIETYLARENLKNMRNNSRDIDFKIWVENLSRNRNKHLKPGQRGTMKISDKVVFHFKSNRDGYVTIVDIQPGGDVVILFPNDLSPNNKIYAGKHYSIPSKDDAFEIVVSEPAGRDTIVAFFTKRKVKWLDRKLLTGEGFKTVKDGQKLTMTRGFKINATRLKRKNWESKAIEIDVSR